MRTPIVLLLITILAGCSRPPPKAAAMEPPPATTPKREPTQGIPQLDDAPVWALANTTVTESRWQQMGPHHIYFLTFSSGPKFPNPDGSVFTLDLKAGVQKMKDNLAAPGLVWTDSPEMIDPSGNRSGSATGKTDTTKIDLAWFEYPNENSIRIAFDQISVK